MPVDLPPPTPEVTALAMLLARANDERTPSWDVHYYIAANLMHNVDLRREAIKLLSEPS